MSADATKRAPAQQSWLDLSDELLAELEEMYKDIHAHPELSMQETRTAGLSAAWLRRHGYEVTEGIGGTGVVGLLRNGEGATVLLRADMDALPIEESTGLSYASRESGIDRFGQSTAIAHSCGHDMHVAWLMGATRILSENRDRWHGTVIAVFQPGEETAQGARAMIEDGMVKRFPKPDVTLGQHVMPLSAGQIGWRKGTMLSAGDSWEVTLYGRGAHGSMPQKSIDPVVMAAAAVMRLQTVVSREVAMTDSAVVTVGTLRAGMSENVIPDRALLRLNVRTFKDQVRTRALAAIRRILDAEAAASGASKPPDYTVLSEYPRTQNDEAAMDRVVAALGHHFGSNRIHEIEPATASEDFSLFGAAWDVPVVFWVIGGIDPDRYRAAEQAGTLDAIPANHAPDFAPVIHPTLRTGVEAMLAAAGAWLISETASSPVA
ncbi:amidohydrolase [Microvirga lotononidis]|uniref:Amidohydrolase n=1 Tax=Microvirga lotononidis TaxID=864069 RepID=I4YXG2_9HYPH|nr:amidohydrolase [Microvirga lotononidis]EIM28654.1 amidohydrolase [Microvirga lotononidis]WQO25603.1 amidohydrolase [Microvirga lotononidis]